MSRETEMFLTKVRWQIYNKNLSEIDYLRVGSIAYDFKITKQEDQEDFIDFLSDKKPLTPIDMCNFFIEEGIDFETTFKYRKDKGVIYKLSSLKDYILTKKYLKTV